VRITILACAIVLLLAQMTGLHFHRHVLAAGPDHGMSLHLRDAGVHVHADQGDHHAPADRASHPDEDVEIDPLGAGIAKVFKVWLSTACLLVTLLCLFVATPAAAVSPERTRRPHPALFVLRPPSHAPPLELSLVR
jgi:hypothetical protein